MTVGCVSFEDDWVRRVVERGRLVVAGRPCLCLCVQHGHVYKQLVSGLSFWNVMPGCCTEMD
jgi:hypothetical protein